MCAEFSLQMQCTRQCHNNLVGKKGPSLPPHPLFTVYSVRGSLGGVFVFRTSPSLWSGRGGEDSTKGSDSLQWSDAKEIVRAANGVN